MFISTRIILAKNKHLVNLICLTSLYFFLNNILQFQNASAGNYHFRPMFIFSFFGFCLNRHRMV